MLLQLEYLNNKQKKSNNIFYVVKKSFWVLNQFKVKCPYYIYFKGMHKIMGENTIKYIKNKYKTNAFSSNHFIMKNHLRGNQSALQLELQIYKNVTIVLWKYKELINKISC